MELVSSGKALQQDAKIILLVKYKVDGKPRETKFDVATIKAASVSPLTTEAKRTIVYFPRLPDGDRRCLEIPLNRQPPPDATVGRIYLPGQDGGVELESKVLNNSILACLNKAPPSAGKYSAKVKPVVNGAGLTDVTLQVTAKHHWYLALLVILAGVSSAYLVQRFIGVTRVLKALSLRINSAVAQIPPDSDKGLLVAAMASAAAQKALASLQKLKKGLFTQFGSDDKNLQTLQTETQNLEQLAATTPSYRQLIEQLKSESIFLNDAMAQAAVTPAGLVRPPHPLQDQFELRLSPRKTELTAVGRKWSRYLLC